LFFHCSQCPAGFERLMAGDRVSFKRGSHHGKACAVEVRVVAQAATSDEPGAAAGRGGGTKIA
jgi:hypothetical protein